MLCPFSEETGHPRGAVAVFVDVTERKLAQEALRNSNKRTVDILESISDGSFRPDKEMVVTHFNSAAAKLLGRDQSEVLGRRLFDAFPEAKGSIFDKKYSEALREGNSISFETYFEPDPYQNWYEVRVFPYEGGISVYFQVTTERKRAEEALSKNHQELQETAQRLEQSRNMLQLIMESIPVRVFWKDRDLRYMGCNTLFARDAGLSQPEQLLGQDDFAMGWREQAELYRADDRQVMESRRPKMNIIEPQTTPQGAKIWLNTSKVPLQMPNGEVFGVLGVYEDITERKQAEEALRQANETLRATLDAAPVAIFDLDTEGRVKSLWNPAAEQMLGWRRDEVLGHFLPTVPEDSKEEFARFREWVRSGKSIMGKDVVRRRKDGSLIEYSIYAAPEYDDDGKVIGNIAVLVDITERKRMEEALLESEQKLVNIIDFLPDATFVIDTKGKVIAWNKAIEDMTGVKAQDMVGKGNYEYALPFYGERRPILIDLVLEPEKGIERYDEVKREDRALMAVAHFTNFRGKETYLFGKASALIDSHGNIIGSIETIQGYHRPPESRNRSLAV